MIPRFNREQKKMEKRLLCLEIEVQKKLPNNASSIAASHGTFSSTELKTRQKPEVYMATIEEQTGWVPMDAQKGNLGVFGKDAAFLFCPRKRAEGGFLLIRDCDITKFIDTEGRYSPGEWMDFESH